jgi:hypothetical protein
VDSADDLTRLPIEWKHTDDAELHDLEDWPKIWVMPSAPHRA